MNLKTNPFSLLFLWLFLIGSIGVYAQADTEVFLMSLEVEEGDITVGIPQNISHNPGYDNQPSFYNDNVVLFSGTRNGQTDIAAYLLNKKEKIWITNTPGASEYSPLKIPGQKRVSAIRLEDSGLQRLYEYPFEKGKVRELLENLKVGYHVWFNEEIIVCTVLVENRMDLVVADLRQNTHYTLYKNVGRSLHKIPNSKLVSFVSREEGRYLIKSLDPISGETKTITELPDGVQDYCWLLNGSILAGQKNRLLLFQPEESAEWKVGHIFPRSGEFGNITRIAVNSLSTQLALVAQASSEIPVQAQLEAYNARDIERFLEPYADDVEVYDYPAIFLYKGKEKMRERYTNLFENTPDLYCELKNRILIGDKVIDEELVTANKMRFSAVAIYDVFNGKITKVTFIR